ncbi:MAG: polysaccharide deacetylase family protein [Bacteroides sp.]|nr:polysaccharide deacetylase family protein [Bacteroides sp.]
MFTYTTSRKKLLRTAVIVLAALTLIALIIMAVAKGSKVVAADKKVPIYAVSRADNRIALTFDCAWGNSNTDLLLSLLKDANAAATFFVTGEFCDKYPEDVKKMHDAGHEIGNHSDLHPHVEGMNINDLIEDTRECSRKIKMITGEEPKVYRAPYGEYDDTTVSTVEGMGLKMIQWSVDSIDWQEPDADTIIERVVSKTESGSILLFHNDLKNTSEALPDVLTKLKQKGFGFVKVSDLVYFDSYHIDGNGVQIYDVSALLPAAKYSDNYLIDEAMEIFRQNLTLQEIYNLTGGATPQLLERTAPLLDSAHLAAIQEASFEELKEAVENLIRVAETEGAGEYAYATTPYEEQAAPESGDGRSGTINGDMFETLPPSSSVSDSAGDQENSSAGSSSEPPIGSVTTNGNPFGDVKAGQPALSSTATTTPPAVTTVPAATTTTAAQTTARPAETSVTTTPQAAARGAGEEIK